VTRRVRQGREVPPGGKFWTLTHVKGCEERDAGKPNPRHGDTRPVTPKWASRRAPNESRRERQTAEDEKVNVVRPANSGKKCHRPEDDHEAPVIDRSGGRMSTDSLRTEHGDHARDDTDKAGCDVYADRSEEKWRGRRDGNPENHDALVGQRGETLVAPPNVQYLDLRYLIA